MEKNELFQLNRQLKIAFCFGIATKSRYLHEVKDIHQNSYMKLDVIKVPYSPPVEDVCFSNYLFQNIIKIVNLFACITKHSNPYHLGLFYM